ncbi:MAG: shikimate kinase [Nocardia sp.]|nr:shikimate kinase [Nocardia sp.]
MTDQTDPHGPVVVLIGPPGAGKTTIGRKLARELGVELYDTDAGIEEVAGRSIPEIFATDGEAEFRRIEEEVVGAALDTRGGVVSLGGGAVLSERTRARLRDRTVVYLEISIAEGLRRTGASTNRPLLGGADPGAKYRELMRTRRPLYREVTSVRVRTDGRSPGRVVRSILGKLSLESVRTTTDTPDAEGTEGTTGQRTGRSRARRRARARARRAAAQRATPTGAAPGGEGAGEPNPTGSGDGGTQPAAVQSTENGLRTPGRSRRARARRARARRQQRDQAEQPQTGSEQHT